MAVKTTFLFSVAAAVIVFTNMYNVNGLSDSYYMEDYCTGTDTQISVGDNGIKLYSQRGAEYRDNLDCKLTFYTSAGHVLILTSNMIQMENGSDCIKLSDGQYTSSQPSVSHCTANDPLNYITSQRYLTVQMTTDNSISSSGFSLSVNDDTNADNYYMEDYCSFSRQQLRVGTDGVNFYSQRGYYYNESLYCTATFFTNIQQGIILRSQRIGLYGGYDCIKLVDGKYTFSDETQVSHCSEDSLSFSTTQRYLSIRFTTTSWGQSTGFLLSLATTNKSADTYYMGDYCSGNTLEVEAVAGIKLYSQRDVNYQENLVCTVTLYTNVGQVITLKSQEIDIGNLYDCIKLFEGQSSGGVPSRRHCSSDKLIYTSTQRYLTIQMTTNGYGNYDGFLLSATVYNNTDVPCSSGYGTYQCLGGNGCYFEYDKCNSYSTCRKNTDDLNCDSCDGSSFHCVSSRHCISKDKVCDDTQDCFNGEDENLPECYPNLWMYWSGGQIAGIVIGYVIFLVVVIAIVVVVNKNCKK